MHQIHYLANYIDVPIELRVLDNQRRSDLEHHEVVATDLTEYSLVTEEPHHQNLAEHRRMDPGEGLERNLQAQTARSPELDRIEQTESADLTDHFVVRQARRQTFAKRGTSGGSPLTEMLFLEDVEGGESRPHHTTHLAVLGSRNHRALQRAVH